MIEKGRMVSVGCGGWFGACSFPLDHAAYLAGIGGGQAGVMVRLQLPGVISALHKDTIRFDSIFDDDGVPRNPIFASAFHGSQIAVPIARSKYQQRLGECFFVIFSRRGAECFKRRHGPATSD